VNLCDRDDRGKIGIKKEGKKNKGGSPAFTLPQMRKGREFGKIEKGRSKPRENPAGRGKLKNPE